MSLSDLCLGTRSPIHWVPGLHPLVPEAQPTVSAHLLLLCPVNRWNQPAREQTWDLQGRNYSALRAHSFN